MRTSRSFLKKTRDAPVSQQENPKKEGAELQNDGGGDRGVFSPPSSELRVLRTVREGPEAGADVDQTDHALP